jgi:hypothetical protein
MGEMGTVVITLPKTAMTPLVTWTALEHTQGMLVKLTALRVSAKLASRFASNPGEIIKILIESNL